MQTQIELLRIEYLVALVVKKVRKLMSSKYKGIALQTLIIALVAVAPVELLASGLEHAVESIQQRCLLGLCISIPLRFGLTLGMGGGELIRFKGKFPQALFFLFAELFIFMMGVAGSALFFAYLSSHGWPRFIPFLVWALIATGASFLEFPMFGKSDAKLGYRLAFIVSALIIPLTVLPIII